MNKYYIRQWMPNGKYQLNWVYAETKQEAIKMATPVKIEIAHVSKNVEVTNDKTN